MSPGGCSAARSIYDRKTGWYWREAHERPCSVCHTSVVSVVLWCIKTSVLSVAVPFYGTTLLTNWAKNCCIKTLLCWQTIRVISRTTRGAFTLFLCMFLTYVKGKSNPITGLDRPWGFHEVEAPRFQDNGHRKVVTSALRTGRLYPPGSIPGTHFC